MISHFDHIVLTVANVDRAVSFYKSVLNMDVVTFEDDRKAMNFGQQYIYFQVLGEELRNHAMEGAGNICLVTNWTMEKLLDHLKQFDVPVLEGPFNKMGVQGAMQSVYFNDPDNNLIEVGVYVDSFEEDKPKSSEEDLRHSEALFEGLSKTGSEEEVSEEPVSEKLTSEDEPVKKESMKSARSTGKTKVTRTRKPKR